MKRPVLLALLSLLPLAVFGQQTNDFFDNTPSRRLPGALKVEVTGEVANPGVIDLERLPLRSVIVREARREKGEVVFVGAYRYEGYSLLDILNDRVVAKKNGAGFPPPTDLLVAVENPVGEKVVLSWGEIYYPAAQHRVLIAAGAAPIVPGETKENWPLPGAVKLVCANDLLAERAILNPTKVTVFTAPLAITGKKGLSPLTVPDFKVIVRNSDGGSLPAAPKGAEPAWSRGEKRSFPSVFYGRGKGYHGFQQFSGIPLREALTGFVALDPARMRRGYVVAASIDGYRIAMSFGELFGRNDQAEFLLVDRGVGADGGRFSIFPAADFFSDRALKAVSDIYILSY